MVSFAPKASFGDRVGIITKHVFLHCLKKNVPGPSNFQKNDVGDGAPSLVAIPGAKSVGSDTWRSRSSVSFSRELQLRKTSPARVVLF